MLDVKKLADCLAALCAMLALIVTLRTVQPERNAIQEVNELATQAQITMNGFRTERLLMNVTERETLESAGKTWQYMRETEEGGKKAFRQLKKVHEIALEYSGTLLAMLMLAATFFPLIGRCADLMPKEHVQ